MGLEIPSGGVLDHSAVPLYDGFAHKSKRRDFGSR
jgi:hypothetical protein